MKRWLTFPPSRPIGYYLLAGILLVISLFTAMLYLPSRAPQLTIIGSQQQYFTRECPDSAKIPLPVSDNSLNFPLTLLNWNIYKQQKQGWLQELQRLSQNSDIITLQEAKLSPQLRAFSDENKLYYLQNHAFKHDNFIYGVSTLSRITAQSVCGNTQLEPWIQVPKSSLASTYRLQGSEQLLLVINLHGINFTLDTVAIQEQISPYLTLIGAHSGPIIMSGDFNTWSDARMQLITRSLEALHFKEVEFEQDRRLTVFSLPLDHIYYRGLQVIKAESLLTNSSDHTPQRVTFDR